jgi:hypothetical protein
LATRDWHFDDIHFVRGCYDPLMRSRLSEAKASLIAGCVILLTIACGGSGCTAMLWQWAATPGAEAGFSENADNISWTPSGSGKQAMVLKYGNRSNDPIHVIIPLTKDDKPPAPFGYAGRATTQSEFAKNISEQQKTDIRQRAQALRGDVFAFNHPVPPVQDDVTPHARN